MEEKENRPINSEKNIKIEIVAYSILKIDTLKSLATCTLTEIEPYYEDAEAWNSESRT